MTKRHQISGRLGESEGYMDVSDNGSIQFYDRLGSFQAKIDDSGNISGRLGASLGRVSDWRSVGSPAGAAQGGGGPVLLFLLGAALVLGTIALLFGPILYAAWYVGDMVSRQVHPALGIVAGLLILAAVAAMLWKVRLSRAVYALPWSFVLQLFSFVSVEKSSDLIWATFTALVVGLVAYSLSIAAYQAGTNSSWKKGALCAVALTATSVPFDFGAKALFLGGFGSPTSSSSQGQEKAVSGARVESVTPDTAVSSAKLAPASSAKPPPDSIKSPVATEHGDGSPSVGFATRDATRADFARLGLAEENTNQGAIVGPIFEWAKLRSVDTTRHLSAGDLVVEAGGRKVTSSDQFIYIVNQQEPGTVLRLRLIGTNGTTYELEATVSAP